jgi:hypothetical protein
MLIRGKDLERLAGVLRGLFGNSVRELFLNAAAYSGVADFGFFGRGFWIDQPIAFKASQSRCGATDMWPSSSAIQFETCGSTRARHRAAVREGDRAASPEDRVSGSLPMRHCGSANRREPRDPRRCNGQAIVRSSARQMPSSPPLVRSCGHAPKARSPENAAMQRSRILMTWVFVRADIVSRPTVEAALPHARDVIWRKIISEAVALVG